MCEPKFVEPDNFEKRNRHVISDMSKNKLLKKLSRSWFDEAFKHEYSYHFKWLGLPIIQFPTDIIALQELIWKIKPDIIIETGIARGGSLVFHASLLELIGKGKVIGIDVDIRKHNRKAIEKHPMFKRIIMLEGSSISKNIVNQVKKLISDKKSILVILDSNHTHNHVLKELQNYSQFVSKGSYIVVFDTVVDEMPEDYFKEKPWNKNNNPKTAVLKFLESNTKFIIDNSIGKKLMITSAPGGFLKRLK